MLCSLKTDHHLENLDNIIIYSIKYSKEYNYSKVNKFCCYNCKRVIWPEYGRKTSISIEKTDGRKNKQDTSVVMLNEVCFDLLNNVMKSG